MIRKAFKMHVYSENIDEYIERHTPVWEELKSVLKKHGAHNYTIFLDKNTHILFGFVEIESEEKWNAVAITEVCEKWWASMAHLMETNKDHSPVSTELEEVFHLE